MTFEIELAGRRRAVDVRRAGAAWVVTFDGRAVAATVSEIGGRWSLLLAGPAEAGLHAQAGPAGGGLHAQAGPAEGGLHAQAGLAEGGLHAQAGPAEGGLHVESGFSRTWRSYEVSFEARGNGGYVVHVNGEPIPLSVTDPRKRARRGHAADAGQGVDGPVPIVAPMPGRIVKVLVRPGDTVAARQGVVVVEAMKMENELRAPRAGNVSDVRVREGMSVEANAVLVVVE